MFAIPKEPSAPKYGYCKVNKDTYKDHHRNDSRRHKSPKRTYCARHTFAGPSGIAYSSAAIQAPVFGEQ